MKQQAHSPLPWACGPDGYILSYDGKVVAEVMARTGNKDLVLRSVNAAPANAALLAAAEAVVEDRYGAMANLIAAVAACRTEKK